MLSLRGGRHRPQPCIGGLATQEERPIFEFSPLDGESGGRLQRIDFKQFRRFLLPNGLQLLRDWLLTKLTLIDGSQDNHAELLHKSFNVYEELFPNEDERDSPTSIEKWVAKANAAKQNGTLWRDPYAVLHTGDIVIGLSFMTGHIERDWYFGNYFGVVTRGRRIFTPQEFFVTVKAQLQKLVPRAKGIIFEIAPVDLSLLRIAAVSREYVKSRTDFDKIKVNMCTALRLRFYLQNGAMELWRSSHVTVIRFCTGNL